MTEPRHAPLEVVELLAASRRWPAGTTGTVVEADDQCALVEIIDDRGHALGLRQPAARQSCVRRPP
jgi:hypothetical protein